MSLFYKKVDAVQFKLNDEEKKIVQSNKTVLFEGGQVKHLGGEVYLTVLQQGENLVRIFEGQWLVRADGGYQIYWPDKFNQIFSKGDETEKFNIGLDPFKAKSFGQPNTLL